MDHLDFIAQRIGTRRWCVAQRLTDRLRQQGYEATVSSKRLRELDREWALAFPDEARDHHVGQDHLLMLLLHPNEQGAIAQAIAASDMNPPTRARLLKVVEGARSRLAGGRA